MLRKPSVTAGSLPERIVYITSGSVETRRYFEWRNKEDLPSEQVTPAFVSDAANAKTIETGKHWAEHRHAYSKDKKEPVVLAEADNKPLRGVRIFTLDIRSEGGRAYKAIIPGGYYVDLREDVLLDAMIEVGIAKNGVLNGEYVFGRVGSQMKLVRVGSELHSQLLAATKRGKAEKLAISDLKVGSVYETKSCKKALFLGFVDANEIRLGRGHYYHDNSAKAIKHRKALLWWAGYDFEHAPFEDLKKDWRKQWGEEDPSKAMTPYRFEITKNHSMIKKVGEVDWPSLSIRAIQQRAVKGLEVDIEKIKKEDRRSGWAWTPERNAEWLASWSKIVCMAPAGEPIPMSDEYQRLWEKCK